MNWKFIQNSLLGIGIALALPLIPRPAVGAERIVLSYGLLQRSIPIDSLATYAKTGKIDRSLAAYAERANANQLLQLRQLLQTRIPLNAVQVSQFLYTPIGEQLLNRLGQLIQTNAHLSGFFAIRGALILSADDPQNFTLLTVLRKFPSPSIRIDLARTLAIAQALQTLVAETNRATALINREALEEATSSPALPPTTDSSNLEAMGDVAYEQRTVILNDLARKRKFPVDLYLPVPRSPYPLIVISHGLGSDRQSFAYLAQHLASYGFAVAVPEHLGSSAEQLQALLQGRANQVVSPREFIDRPLDVIYLLDGLQQLAQTDPTLAQRFDTQNVGVLGQSFGGYTALALAGAPIGSTQLRADCQLFNNSINVSLLLQCLALELPEPQYNLADRRVKAAIAINPITSGVFNEASLQQIRVPVMIVASGADTIAPAFLEQIEPFTLLTSPDKYLVLINNGTHFSTIGESRNATVSLPQQVIGPNPAIARRYMEALSLAFFQAYLANRPGYLPYLSAAYASRISRDPLPLSLVRSLTATDLEQAATVTSSQF
jgi:predicted dienelactone hydrolase